MTDNDSSAHRPTEISARTATVLTSRKGDALSITLSNPRARNAITPAMARSVTGHLRKAPARGIRVILMRGDGCDFTSGAYLTSDQRTGRQALFSRGADAEPYNELFKAIGDSDVPVIACIRGYSLGAGAAIAATATLAISADDAIFGLPEVRYGLFPASLIAHLSRKVGPAQALSWGLSGENFSAGEAASAGLVQAITQPGESDIFAETVAGHILNLDPAQYHVLSQMLVSLRQGLGGESLRERAQYLLENAPNAAAIKRASSQPIRRADNEPN